MNNPVSDEITNFRQQTISGIAWSSISNIVRQISSIIVSIILARLMSPSEFGLIAMVTVLTNFLQIYINEGFSTAIIQKKNLTSMQCSSAFWLNISAGFVFMALFILLSPFIALFYEQPILQFMTILIAVNFPLSSLGIVQRALIRKNLGFKVLCFIDVGAIIISGIVAIVLVYMGFGVWSLIIQVLLLSSLSSLFLWIKSAWTPGFVFKWAAVRHLLHFSSNVWGNTTLNYIVRNLDNLLIGKYIGAVALGNYGRAYSLMLMPLRSISSVFAKVMLPSFSIIQTDKLRVKNLYLRMVSVISLFTFPMVFGFFIVAEHFVLSVLGDQWADCIPILKILCLCSWTQSIFTTVGAIYHSQGRPDLALKIGAFQKCIIVMGIVIGLKWGVLGVATGYAIASLINCIPCSYFPGRLINMTPWELWRSLSGIIFCALTMAIFTYFIGTCLPKEWPHWAFLLVMVFFGMIIYMGLLFVTKLNVYYDLKNVVTEQLIKNRS